jgi:hypothetical protein
LWPSTMLVSSSHARPTKLSHPPPHRRSPRIRIAPRSGLIHKTTRSARIIRSSISETIRQ